MHIKIHNKTRLSEDEYKFLLLLEFNDNFEPEIIKIRKLYKIHIFKKIQEWNSFPMSKRLIQGIEKLLIKLKIPLSLYSAIEQIIFLGKVIGDVYPIYAVGMAQSKFRKALYNSKISEKPRGQDSVDSEKMIDWYQSNKKILSESSYFAASPLIVIAKRLTKKQLFKAIDVWWNRIDEDMADFENSLPFKVSLAHIPLNGIEDNIAIYRYRQSGLTHRQICEKLESEGRHFTEETVKKRYSEFRKLLIQLGFVSENFESDNSHD